MTNNYDCIVLGVGGVGSAALAEIARRGQRALGLETFLPGHDRGSSHGQTRIIRRAYFEHPDYVPLVERAYARWRVLEDRSGQQLLYPVGLLQVGPPEGPVVRGTLASAAQHHLEVEQLSAQKVERRFPGAKLPEGMVGLFEPGAGYLRVEDCVRAHVDDAIRAGAVVHAGEAVRSWHATDATVEVVTDRARYSAARLVIAAGPWSPRILAGLNLPCIVRRKTVYWFAPEARKKYTAERGFPTFLFEMPNGVFYGFPQIDPRGLKVAEHSGGPEVVDPTTVSRDLDRADLSRVESFLRQCLPDVGVSLKSHSVCMYTLTPDEHFILDRHPQHRCVSFCAGLSGHGFKFTPTLGEALADLALDGRTTLPIEFLSLSRFGARAQ